MPSIFGAQPAALWSDSESIVSADAMTDDEDDDEDIVVGDAAEAGDAASAGAGAALAAADGVLSPFLGFMGVAEDDEGCDGGGPTATSTTARTDVDPDTALLWLDEAESLLTRLPSASPPQQSRTTTTLIASETTTTSTTTTSALRGCSSNGFQSWLSVHRGLLDTLECPDPGLASVRSSHSPVSRLRRRGDNGGSGSSMRGMGGRRDSGCQTPPQRSVALTELPSSATSGRSLEPEQQDLSKRFDAETVDDGGDDDDDDELLKTLPSPAPQPRHHHHHHHHHPHHTAAATAAAAASIVATGTGAPVAAAAAAESAAASAAAAAADDDSEDDSDEDARHHPVRPPPNSPQLRASQSRPKSASSGRSVSPLSRSSRQGSCYSASTATTTATTAAAAAAARRRSAAADPRLDRGREFSERYFADHGGYRLAKYNRASSVTSALSPSHRRSRSLGSPPAVSYAAANSQHVISLVTNSNYTTRLSYSEPVAEAQERARRRVRAAATTATSRHHQPPRLATSASVRSSRSRSRSLPQRQRSVPGLRDAAAAAAALSAEEEALDSEDAAVLVSLTAAPWPQRLQRLTDVEARLRAGRLPSAGTAAGVARLGAAVAAQLRDEHAAVASRAAAALGALCTAVAAARHGLPAAACTAPAFAALLATVLRASASQGHRDAARVALRAAAAAAAEAPAELLGAAFSAARGAGVAGGDGREGGAGGGGREEEAAAEAVADLLEASVALATATVTLAAYLPQQGGAQEVRAASSVPYGHGHRRVARVFADTLDVPPDSVRAFHKGQQLLERGGSAALRSARAEAEHARLVPHRSDLFCFLEARLQSGGWRGCPAVGAEGARCFWLAYLVFPAEAESLYEGLSYRTRTSLHRHKPAKPPFVLPDALRLQPREHAMERRASEEEAAAAAAAAAANATAESVHHARASSMQKGKVVAFASSVVSRSRIGVVN